MGNPSEHLSSNKVLILVMLELENIQRRVRNVLRYCGHTVDEQRLVLLQGATRSFRNDDVITTAAHDNAFNQFIKV